MPCKDSIYLFLDRGKGREGTGEKHRCVRDTLIGYLSFMPRLGTEPATQAYARTGDQIGSPLTHAGTQSTELHQPGCELIFILTGLLWLL